MDCGKRRAPGFERRSQARRQANLFSRNGLGDKIAGLKTREKPFAADVALFRERVDPFPQVREVDDSLTQQINRAGAFSSVR